MIIYSNKTQKKDNILIFALGSGATNAICEFKKKIDNYYTISIVSNYSDGIKTPDIKIVIGLKNNDGLSTNGDIELARENFLENKNEIRSFIVSNTKDIILIVNSSGGTSAGSLIEFIKLINEINSKLSDKICIHILYIDPQKFEGKKRLKISTIFWELYSKIENKNCIKNFIEVKKDKINRNQDIISYFEELDILIGLSLARLLKTIENNLDANCY